MLRLSVAASLAFPDGGITAGSLRRKASRGRLEIWLIANKHFTTLGAIKQMRELCRLPVPRPVRDWRPDPVVDRTSGLSPKDALLAKLAKQKASDDQERKTAREACKRLSKSD